MADDLTPPAKPSAGEGKKKLTLRAGRTAENPEGAVPQASQCDEAPQGARVKPKKRYLVTPKATEKPAARPRRTSGAGRRGEGRAGAKSATAGGKRPAREPVVKKLPDDPDHQWLKRELRAAETVAQVLARQAQFENKIRALKLRHAPERPLYQYAERMEAFLKRLTAYPWTAQLRDIRQDDAQVRKLKL